MEKKLLKIIELANVLSEKQKNVYAKIEYTKKDSKRLEVKIISKKNL